LEGYLRVLHVNDCAGVAKNLVVGLNSNGVEAELFQPKIGTYRVSKLRRAMLPFTRTMEAFRLGDFVRRNHFDIVHIHYARFAYMAFLSQLPYVLHCHGSDLYLDLQRIGFRKLTITAIQKAQKVFYSTPDLYKFLAPIRSDAEFLPSPIDLENFYPQIKPQSEPSRVLSISKLDRRKGIDQIIRIIELLWQSRVNLKIAIINYGQDSLEAKRFINEHNNDNRLILLPLIPHKDMPSLINSFDIILGQQCLEVGALGISELESMACAKPVVSYYSYPNAYPKEPPVLSSPSPEDSSTNILKLLDDITLQHQIGNNAREWVIDYHEMNNVARNLISYYKTL
jgi:glycosyltransferase involved in cell wall biosynthesis